MVHCGALRQKNLRNYSNLHHNACLLSWHHMVVKPKKVTPMYWTTRKNVPNITHSLNYRLRFSSIRCIFWKRHKDRAVCVLVAIGIATCDRRVESQSLRSRTLRQTGRTSQANGGWSFLPPTEGNFFKHAFLNTPSPKQLNILGCSALGCNMRSFRRYTLFRKRGHKTTKKTSSIWSLHSTGNRQLREIIGSRWQWTDILEWLREILWYIIKEIDGWCVVSRCSLNFGHR